MKSGEIQHSIFESILEVVTGKAKTRWELRVDGASRGNPGLAGAGIYLSKNGQEIAKVGFFLGIKTNNEAEYLALLIGVILLKSHAQEEDNVLVISDSQLLIRQLDGTYRVKKSELQVFHRAIFVELGSMNCEFKHVEREQNSIADMLANRGIDTKKSLPLKVLDKLQTHEIFL